MYLPCVLMPVISDSAESDREGYHSSVSSHEPNFATATERQTWQENGSSDGDLQQQLQYPWLHDWRTAGRR